MTVPIWTIFGQAIPAAATPALLYTVARGKQSNLETLTVCNQSAVATTFRVRIRRAGAVDAAEQYLYYDQSIAANTTYVHWWTLKLGTLDNVWVESASGTVSFNAFGQEVFA
jgi:hypothetical protein